MQAFGCFFRKKIELFYYFIHGDGFGCLHTEDISGHKIEGLPFFAKKHPPLHICPARCGSKFGGKIPNNRQNEVAENSP